MRKVTLPLPALGYVIGTRAALAAGLALTFGCRIPERRRAAIGRTLIAIGVATTAPIIWWALRGRRHVSALGVESDADLVGVTRLPRRGDEPY